MPKAFGDGVCLFCRLQVRSKLTRSIATQSRVERANSKEEEQRHELRKHARHRQAARPPQSSVSLQASQEPHTRSIGFNKEQLQRQVELRSGVDVLRTLFLNPARGRRAVNIHERVQKNFTYLQERQADKWRNAKMHRAHMLHHPDGKNLNLSMDLLRMQLKSCLSPEDAIRVLTVALQQADGANSLVTGPAACLANPSIQRILQRQMTGLDPERLLRLWSLFINRLAQRGRTAETWLIWTALECAAAAPSYTAVRSYLKLWQDTCGQSSGRMDRESFISFLNCLHRGYNKKGSIDRQTTKTAILEILLGFSNPEYRGYHLLQSMPSHDWDCLSLFIRTLGDCGAKETIWEYWELLNEDASRGVRYRIGRPPPSIVPDSKAVGRRSLDKERGEIFIVALVRAGAPDLAWRVLKEHGAAMMKGEEWEEAPIGKDVWDALADYVELMPELDEKLQRTFDEQLRLRLQDRLETMEDNLGIVWVDSAEPDGGQHMFVDDDMEATMYRWMLLQPDRSLGMTLVES